MATTNVIKYSKTIRFFHWTLAFLLFALFAAGTIMHNSSDEAMKFAILKLHAPLGLLAGAMLLARTFFAFRHARPAADPNWSFAVRWGSKIVHVLLYIAPIALVITGYSTLILSGLGDILRKGQPEVWPDLSNVGPAFGHAMFSKLFLASLALHLAGVIFHQFMVKDNLLARMMPVPKK